MVHPRPPPPSTVSLVLRNFPDTKLLPHLSANITSPTFQIKPEWELYYSARDHYGPLVGLADDEALDAPFWHKLTEVFAANECVISSLGV